VDTQPSPHGYSRSHRALEIISILLVFAGLVAMGIRIATTISTTAGWVCLAIVALTAYLLADFISGFVHWAGDTLGDTSTPVLGKNFIMPFRYHHVDPKDITRHDFVETNGNNCIVVLAPLAASFLFLPGETGVRFFACAMMAFVALFVVATNQFHKWAHADNLPRAAALLQRWGLILSKGHHDIHHTAPHHRHYCITVGWMNPLLNRVRFFRALEAVIGAIWPSVLHLEERHAFTAAAAAASSAPQDEAAPPPDSGRAQPI
jgi:ubiquitin-conjugating enzyme E2 variant